MAMRRSPFVASAKPTSGVTSEFEEQPSAPTMSDAASRGLRLTAIDSQKLCDGLRTAVSDATFGRPVAPEVINYDPGRSEDNIQVSCKLVTDSVEVESDPSGGGLSQPGLAALNFSGPYRKDGVPSYRTSSEWVDYSPDCQGKDSELLGSPAATVWCVDDTALGTTDIFFNDALLHFEMQAPLMMTRPLTFDLFNSTRSKVLDAISG